eukprot:m.166972 g.166972  ORF g.166972 m.166972 type:complete len:343 (+) comp18179_c0_seq1:295-1323(+)
MFRRSAGVLFSNQLFTGASRRFAHGGHLESQSLRGCAFAARTRVSSHHSLGGVTWSHARVSFNNICARANAVLQPCGRRVLTTRTPTTKSACIVLETAAVSQASNGIGNKLLAFATKRPFLVGISIATVKTALADLIVQMVVERKSWDQVDWRRNNAFLAFGFFYMGIVVSLVYIKAFRVAFKGVDAFCNKPFREKLRDKQGMLMLTKQVFADILIVQPFLYWPIYYTFKEVTFAPADDPRSLGAVVMDALHKTVSSCVVDNLGMSAFWIPANYYIYAVPMYLRLPINHAVSLVWCCILSFWRGPADSGNTDAIDDDVAPVRATTVHDSTALSHGEGAMQRF